MNASPESNGNDKGTNLIWIDLEMTGLDPEKEVIIEMASVATDRELNIIEEGPVIAIHQDDNVLEGMDDWNKKCHTATGLIERVRQSEVSLKEAETMTMAFVQKHTHPKASPLCGSSIEHDRRFIIKYMPRLDAILHFRHINVSTVKEIVLRWYPDRPESVFKKEKPHQALADILESIEELRYYRKHFFKSEFST